MQKKDQALSLTKNVPEHNNKFLIHLEEEWNLNTKKL